MIKRMIVISSHFLMELNMSILFLFLFYINNNQLPPVLLLGILAIGSLLLFTITLEKFFNKGKWIFFVTILPVQVVVGEYAGLSIFTGLILGLFVFWRGLALYEDATLQSDTLLLFLSVLIGLLAVVYSGMSHYSYQNQIILLLIFQILLIIMGDFIRKWNLIKADKAKFAIYFIKIITALSVIGAIVAFLLKYIQLVFFDVIKIFAWIFSSIAGPILNLLYYLVLSHGSEEWKTSLQESDVLEKAEKYNEQSYGITENLLYILLTVGAFLFISYLIYKKKVKQHDESTRASSMVKIFEDAYITTQVSFFPKKGKPPENLIRREIFILEKFAVKIKLGRYSAETLKEWWSRVGLTGSEEIIEIYDKVRYGEFPISKEEEIETAKKIRHIRQELKEIYKNNSR